MHIILRKSVLPVLLCLFVNANGFALSLKLDTDTIISDTIFQEFFSAKYQYDFIPDASYELIADRISCIKSEVPLTLNAQVKGFIDYFTIRDRNYTRMVLRRQHLYFPLFEKYLKKHGMPDELKYLAVVESGLNTRAVSRAGAVGLWQFMPATGRSFKLYQDAYIDDRMDPEKATEAACLYLKELYNMFNDWELALASYNAGPGNIRKAIRKAGGKKNFWAIYNYIPRETRAYVPQFVALTYVMNYPHEHNFWEQDYEYFMAHDTVHLQGTDLELLASQLNICHEDIQKLNPSIKKNILPGNRQVAIKLPTHVISTFAENRVAILDSAKVKPEVEKMVVASQTTTVQKTTTTQEKIIYKVKRGDALGSIASKHNVSLDQLRSWNNIKGSKILVGQNLVIWVNKTTTTPVGKPTVAQAKPAASPQAQANTSNNINVKYHQVQPGDTLWKISQRYEGLTVDKIKKLNNLKDNNIKVGQKLVIRN
jgi:membrane-bound lytic murein transglycosylase D